MSLYGEWQSDWSSPYPFRLISIQSQHDEPLGQWLVTVAVLGLSVTLVWEYTDTPLKAELTDMMADDAWLQKSHVSMPYADYEALKADAEKWRESQG